MQGQNYTKAKVDPMVGRRNKKIEKIKQETKCKAVDKKF